MRCPSDPTCRAALFILAVLLPISPVLTPEAASAQEPASATTSELDSKTLEREFEATMTDARLVGRFNVLSPDGESAAREDLYMVSSLSRGEGATWVFTSKMKYGETEVAIPVPTEVKWAGDTPVITLTNQEIPGMGTFTARVMIYKDRYAGTWQHGSVGGHMWGRIEKVESETETAEPTDGSS